LVDAVSDGEIRIPAFQRGFVWDAEKVAYLMDSIHKKYPFGTLLLWHTRAQLKHEKQLGPFKLPEPRTDYPIYYVLDGQQRITSIFGVFQHAMPTSQDYDPFRIHFDYTADPDAQDPQFLALKLGENDPSKHFPMNVLFDVSAFRATTRNLDDAVMERISRLQQTFQEAMIPAQVVETEEKPKVAIVFERINRMGVELDTPQLLNAWTWSEEFDLQTQFEALSEELSDFGFSEVGKNADLVLRCCAAVLSKRSGAEALVTLNGAEVRDHFAEITAGIKGAIDFLRHNLSVERLENLPYETLLVPLCAFFASPPTQEVRMTSDQRKTILRWVWRALFTLRYSAGVQRNIDRDILAMDTLRRDGKSDLGSFSASLDESFFTGNTFSLSSVNTKTFVLMLCQYTPKSFISGNPVDLAEVLRAYNRREFHHLFPAKYLRAANWGQQPINSLANIAVVSRGDNNQLGGVSPKEYAAKMPADKKEILQHAICPESLFTTVAEDYPIFLKERSELLVAAARSLIA
jgi:hypothetical protein